MSAAEDMTPGMSLVCFAFAVTQVGPGQALAGPVLLRVLADLGLSGSAARSLLLRMRRHGWLSSERVGRQARYRLTPVIDVAQTRLGRQLQGERPPWSGSFNGVLYEVPQRHRAFRDRLRRSAQLLGYVVLRPGLLVATSDRWDELTSLLPPHPDGSQVLRTRLTLSAGDSRLMAADLWHLDELAARYRAVLADARARTDRVARHPPRREEAFRAFVASTFPLYDVGTQDPDLPTVLLPPDWPGDKLRVAFNEAFQVFHPLLEAARAGQERPADERRHGPQRRPAATAGR